MTNDFEAEKQRALSRKLRDGVDGSFPSRESVETRPPTPSPAIGIRGDASKRRKQLDDAEDKILNG